MYIVLKAWKRDARFSKARGMLFVHDLDPVDGLLHAVANTLEMVDAGH